MSDLSLRPDVSSRIMPFVNEILKRRREAIHSIHITGSAVTDDFDPKGSDINSVFVLREMDFGFLELLAPLGKKYGKKKISAPLIMTPEYIKTSLDVFPLEFLNIKLAHETVFGEDIFNDLKINRLNLRHQCERELKVRLIGLRQRYISSLADPKMLVEGFISSVSGYISLFRGIISLLGKEPPLKNHEVITALGDASGISVEAFREVLKCKKDRIKLPLTRLNAIFKDYYSTIEKLGYIVDAIKE